MSTSIANQTWEMINSVNDAINQGERSQKQGEARIAEQNSASASRLTDLQQVEKDVILPSNAKEGIGNTTSQAGVPSKPQLPNPNPGFNWGAFSGVGQREVGLIAIIGDVLCQQARMNTKYWSTLWKQASESMQMEVDFAPLIADSIKSAYTAQSMATQAQANQSKEDGIINLTMFSGAMLMSVYAEATDEENPLNKPNDESAVTNETDAEPVEGEEEELNEQESNLIEESIDKSGESGVSFKDRMTKLFSEGKDKYTIGQRRLASFLDRGMKSTMMMSMLSQGLTGYFVDSKYQGQQSVYQGQEGQCQALSKLGEQYSQYYGQSFSRTEDLRQGVSQNFDYLLNILKGVADSVSQTVESMFRG